MTPINLLFFASFSTMTSFTTAFTALSRSVTAKAATRRSMSTFHRTLQMNADSGQAEVVLVGCGAPNRGMGWYHGVQMVESK